MPNNNLGNNDPRLLKTVTLTCKILFALKEEERAGVTTLSNRLGLSKGAVYNHLATLHKYGLVAKEEEKYHIGIRFINFGEHVKNRSIVLQNGLKESEELAADTGEYIHLMEVQENHGVFVYRAQGKNAVGDEYYSHNQEQTDSFYYTATGKAALAFMKNNKRKHILKNINLNPHTKYTKTSLRKLRDELSSIRKRGFALNDEEQFLGLRAVGAPIRDNENQVVGAVSISGPVSRIPDEKFENELPKKIIETSNVIELHIKQWQALS